MIAAASLSAGCAALQEKLAEAGGAPKEGMALARLVTEVVNVVQTTSSERLAVLAKAREAFLEQASDENRLRYAAMLAILPPPARDEAQAGSLLQPLASRKDSSLGRFAALLAAQISERTAATREKDRALRASEGREDTLKQQNEQLRGQIEALRAIERGILKREDKLRTK